MTLRREDLTKPVRFPDLVLYLDAETTLTHGHIHMVAWRAIRRRPDGLFAPEGETYHVTSEDADAAAQVAAVCSMVPAVAAHNGVNFDKPVLERVWKLKLPRMLDSMLLAQMRYPDSPGGHSLAALLAEYTPYRKREYTGGFDRLTPEMVEYGDDDVTGGAHLMAHLMNEIEAAGFSQFSVDLEHAAAEEVRLMVEAGFRLDIPRTMAFNAELADEVSRLEEQIRQDFYPTVKPLLGKPRTAYPDLATKEEAEAVCRKYGLPWPGDSKVGLYRVIPVLVTSREQLIERLLFKGWRPVKFTVKSLEAQKAAKKAGDPKHMDLLRPVLDDEVLEHVQFREGKLILRYFQAQKLRAYTQSWLDKAGEDGRVRCRITCIGAPTARMAHSNPNLGQVPKVGNPGGEESRSCWTVDHGMVQVGVDASNAQAYLLAHYAQDAEMTYEITEGDFHSKTQEALAFDSRGTAKTWFYAWLFGAKAGKLSTISGRKKAEAEEDLVKFDRRWPAIPALNRKLERIHGKAGSIPGLDGRRFYVRKAHARLNTLLQGAEAILMKVALVLAGPAVRELGGRIVMMVHDEFQVECPPAVAEEVRDQVASCIVAAGQLLGVRVPMKGDGKIGTNWATTH